MRPPEYLNEHKPISIDRGIPDLAGNEELWILASGKDVEAHIKDAAADIGVDYTPIADNTVFIPILKGGGYFMSHLNSYFPPELRNKIYPARARRLYQSSTLDDVEIMQMPTREQLSGKDVLLVEGVVDNQITLRGIYEFLAQYPIKSLHAAVLIDKTEAERHADLPDGFIRYKVYETGNPWLVGSGADTKDRQTNWSRFRDLRCLAALKVQNSPSLSGLAS